jgi:hypothetical protein
MTRSGHLPLIDAEQKKDGTRSGFEIADVVDVVWGGE